MLNSMDDCYCTLYLSIQEGPLNTVLGSSRTAEALTFPNQPYPMFGFHEMFREEYRRTNCGNISREFIEDIIERICISCLLQQADPDFPSFHHSRLRVLNVMNYFKNIRGWGTIFRSFLDATVDDEFTIY